jgi:hypothetical protein
MDRSLPLRDFRKRPMAAMSAMTRDAGDLQTPISRYNVLP